MVKTLQWEQDVEELNIVLANMHRKKDSKRCINFQISWLLTLYELESKYFDI